MLMLMSRIMNLSAWLWERSLRQNRSGHMHNTRAHLVSIRTRMLSGFGRASSADALACSAISMCTVLTYFRQHRKTDRSSISAKVFSVPPEEYQSKWSNLTTHLGNDCYGAFMHMNHRFTQRLSASRFQIRAPLG